MQPLVITAVGPDRPGLVDEISGFLAKQGGNIADSRMVNLRGQFAMILLVEAPGAAAEAIRQHAAAAGGRVGLTVTVTLAATSGTIPATAAGTLPGAGVGGLVFELRTYAMDQPGIVHRVTAVLHKHKINIEEMQTHLQPGSVSGTPLFSMNLTIRVPPGVPVKGLRQELSALCESLNCDFEMTPA